MKKQITAFLILIFTAAGLAAETGYKGLNWGSSESLIVAKEGNEEYPVPEKSQIYPMEYDKKLLGEDTRFFYLVEKSQGLIGAYYITSEKNNDKLASNLRTKTKVREYPFVRDAENQLWTRTEKEMGSATIPWAVEFSVGYYMWTFAAVIESEMQYEEATGKGLEGKIIVYDYNEDTRLYIFENVLPGKTVVAYLPHEDDY